MTLRQPQVETGTTTEMLADSMGLNRPLRLGLICDSCSQPHWVRKVLGDLLSVKIIEIPLIVVAEASHESAPGKFQFMLGNFWRHRSHWLYHLYLAFDRMVSRMKPNAMALGQLDEMASLSSKIAVKIDETGLKTRLTQTDVNTIASYDLDIVFCSGLIVDGVDTIHLASYGVWIAESLGNLSNSSHAEAFWEVMEGFPVLKTELQRHDVSLGQRQVLCRSVLPTHLPDDLWSFCGASNRLLWVTAALLYRKLKDLHFTGNQSLRGCSPKDSREPILLTSQPPPDNKRIIKLAVKRTVQRIKAWSKNVSGFDQWGLGYKFHDSVESGFGISGFTKMVPPKDRFWADPFPVKHGDRYFIFIEEFLYATKKGYIAVIEMDADGRWHKPVKIIERGYHLSYPFVFQWEGYYYMVPETGSNRTIELYKCAHFPFDWKLDRIMIGNLQAADPTLEEIDGTWWLFAGTRPYDIMRDDNYMELSLFSSDTPMGPWRPHPNNPVKSDVRSSRPAGKLFWRNGHLHRPAQDCSRDYGYAVSINRVTKLTQEEFEEEEVGKILPEWIPGSKCVHTLNTCEGLIIVDMMSSVLRL